MTHPLFHSNLRRNKDFYQDYLAELKESLIFAAVKQLAMTYQGNNVLQRIIQFFASFCTLSLVNPNNLLTHTHTQALPAFKHIIFLLSYARAKRVVTLVNKGLLGVSFVRFFVSICELSRRQNKNVLSTEITVTDNCNSLIIVCFLSLISRAGSSDMLFARRERRGQAIRKDK